MTTNIRTLTAPSPRPLRARERYSRRLLKQIQDQSFIGTLRAFLARSFSALMNTTARQPERARSPGSRATSIPPAGMNIPESGQ